MTNIAIRVENLSKQYKIGKAQQRHDTLRDALVDGFLPRITRIGRKEKSVEIRPIRGQNEPIRGQKQKGSGHGLHGLHGLGTEKNPSNWSWR